MKNLNFTLKIVCFTIILLTIVELSSCSNEVVYSVKTNVNMSQDVFDYSVTISNKETIIQPMVFVTSSYETTWVDGVCIRETLKDYVGFNDYDMVAHIEDIPSIEQTKQMKLLLDDTASFYNVKIYDSSALLIDDRASWEELSNLVVGQYFVILSICNKIEESYVCSLHLFTLYVTEI